jgi:ribonuclease PH
VLFFAFSNERVVSLASEPDILDALTSVSSRDDGWVKVRTAMTSVSVTRREERWRWQC